MAVGTGFFLECLPARTARNIRYCVCLSLYSRELLRQLRRKLSIEYDQPDRGILHFYTDRAAFEVAPAPAALMRELGCDRRSISAAEAVAIEPALAPLKDRIVGADFCTEDASGDVFQFTAVLAGHARACGVQFLFGHQVTRVLTEGGRATAVEAIGGDGWIRILRADAFVVALGVHSRALLAPLGIGLLLYPGEGYSATYEIVAPARANTVSLTDDQYKLVFSRLGNRLRVAGTAELSGYDRSPSAQRCAMPTRRTQEMLPGVCDYERPHYWAGLRPVTPSNVPLIGATHVPRPVRQHRPRHPGMDHGCRQRKTDRRS